MKPILEQHIGEIVASNYLNAGVFHKYGIDFCCGGGVTLAHACAKHNLSTETIIGELEAEHEAAGSLMATIREASNGFTPPEDACATYRILYKNLAEFETDLHKHVHLENNILFKRP